LTSFPPSGLLCFVITAVQQNLGSGTNSADEDLGVDWLILADGAEFEC
jgi:hypothetical protein